MKNLLTKKLVKTDAKKLPEPELKRIPIANIKFAPHQRELRQSKIKKIVDNFIPDIVGEALVSFRDGEFYCIDAQHRIKALEQIGYTEILCHVITGLTYEEECLRFTLLNTSRTKLNPNQIFHARVEGRDENALALVRTFKNYNFEYNKDNSVKKNNYIGAVSTFVRIQKTYGINMVDRVLRVLRKSWYGDVNSLQSSIATGLSTFFAEYPDAKEDILVETLSHISPDELMMSAAAYMKFGIVKPNRSDRTCYHVAKQIAELYNGGLAKLMKQNKRGSKCQIENS